MTSLPVRSRANGRPPVDRQVRSSMLQPWQKQIVEQMRQLGFGTLRLIWTQGELRYHGEDAIVQRDDLTRDAWVPSVSATGRDYLVDVGYLRLFERASNRPEGTIHLVKVANGLPVHIDLTIPLPLR